MRVEVTVAPEEEVTIAKHNSHFPTAAIMGPCRRSLHLDLNDILKFTRAYTGTTFLTRKT